MTKDEAKAKAVAAINAAYNAVEVDDIGNMTSWELRDLCINAVERAFSSQQARQKQDSDAGAK